MAVSTSRRRGQCRMRHTSPLEKGGCQNGQHAVFGPLHRQAAGEGPPATG